MKTLHKYSIHWLLALCCVLLSIACDKNSELFKEFNPERMFMPSKEIGAESGETEVKLTWGEALNTEKASYVVEISKDTLFANGPLFSLDTDTAGVILTDQQIEVRTKYFARVLTVGTGQSDDSHWLHSNGFMIRGKQLFNLLDEQVDLQDKSVRLTWRPDETATTIIIGKLTGEINEETGGEKFDIIHQINLTADEIASGERLVEDLQSETPYVAILYARDVQIGILKFTTKATSNFTIEIGPEDDLAQVIADAENQAVIGLRAGTYNLTENVVRIENKHITLGSVSGNPANTKINPKGFELRGDGAGIHFNDLTIDMLGTPDLYLVDLPAGAATFTSIHLQGCRIHGIGRALVRGSRAGNREHKIDYIRVENSIVQDNDQDYALFELQKLQMNRFELVNSTFNRLSTNILRYDVNIGTPRASILIDYCTINAFGNTGGKRPLMDVNTPADIVVSNSILANTGWISPRFTSLSMNNDLLRAANGATARIANTNVFNLLNSATPRAKLNIPNGVVTATVLEVALPWDVNTDDFTLPANSSLREASSNAGPIGDPRWAR
ncbi:DUF4957 domain-containing protein [Sphingobacterium chuzhouense]|uniref:DUF4957 domain-containing protein n=1 Tax=Sphingobacterium chuzhouense TaxID=1742264 RepID=A0ABR7XS75_9SPHI|nr:DUF4957 domain-containing protein [Sphingobacterium chuzhouense]MBD1421142.1 DUF4957 domain-containing protein [Sphingobacterium chuzhouense]